MEIKNYKLNLIRFYGAFIKKYFTADFLGQAINLFPPRFFNYFLRHFFFWANHFIDFFP